MEWKIRENMHTLPWGVGGAEWGIQNWWRLEDIPFFIPLGSLWKFSEITPMKMSPIDSYIYLNCWCGECDAFWSNTCQPTWNRHHRPTDACLRDPQCVTNNREISGGIVSDCCQDLKAIISRSMFKILVEVIAKEMYFPTADMKCKWAPVFLPVYHIPSYR